MPGLSTENTAERRCLISPVSNAPVTDVAVWEIRPEFVTTIFWPTFTVSAFGAKPHLTTFFGSTIVSLAAPATLPPAKVLFDFGTS